MSDLVLVPVGGKTLSPEEKLEITNQCDRIIDSSWFRTSFRCSNLLRHLVDAAIHGRADQLRERLIAVRVFQRKPSYDNSTDPVVRVAAGEVRKRLAQYYNDPGNSGQIYIDLPVGSYVPEFHFASQAEPPARLFRLEMPVPLLEENLSLPEASLAQGGDPQRDPGLRRRLSHRTKKWILAIALILFFAGLGIWLRVHSIRQVSGFDAFWTPVISAKNTPLIAIGDVEINHVEIVPSGQRSPVSNADTLSIDNDHNSLIELRTLAFGNALAAAEVAAIFGENGKQFAMSSQSKVMFDALSQHPVIQIGSWDNDWTIRDTDTMRFRFEIDMNQKIRWIGDRERPTEQFGISHFAEPLPATYEDYSIVARVVDPSTGQPAVILAGITSLGTVAAANFVSDSSYLNDFARKAPKNWANKNVEFLIATSIVDHAAGRSKIVSYSLW